MEGFAQKAKPADEPGTWPKVDARLAAQMCVESGRHLTSSICAGGGGGGVAGDEARGAG